MGKAGVAVGLLSMFAGSMIAGLALDENTAATPLQTYILTMSQIAQSL